MSGCSSILDFLFHTQYFLYCNLIFCTRLFYLQKQPASIHLAQAVDFWRKWFLAVVSCFLSGINLL